MENEIIEIADKPKPKRGRPFKKRDEGEAPPKVKFAGLTQNDCPTECNADHCVISGKPYCGHPYKGGLRHADMIDPTAVKHVAQAKAQLARQGLEKKLKAG